MFGSVVSKCSQEHGDCLLATLGKKWVLHTLGRISGKRASVSMVYAERGLNWDSQN